MIQTNVYKYLSTLLEWRECFEDEALKEERELCTIDKAAGQIWFCFSLYSFWILIDIFCYYLILGLFTQIIFEHDAGSKEKSEK